MSRPEADGKTHTVSAAAWKILLLWLVFVANALIWGGIAIYQSRAADRVTRKPPMHDKSRLRQAIDAANIPGMRVLEVESPAGVARVYLHSADRPRAALLLVMAQGEGWRRPTWWRRVWLLWRRV